MSRVHAPLTEDGADVLGEIRWAIEGIGWSETSRRSGLDRVSLHRCFGDSGKRDPKLSTIARLLPHLGLKLVVVRAG